MRVRVTWGICLFLILSVSHAETDDTLSGVRPWIAKMSRAAHELNYEGTFVYLHNKQMRSLRVIHTVDAQGEREHLVSLDGPGQELIRDNSMITRVLPPGSDARSQPPHQRSLPGALNNSIDELSKYYSFSLGDKERVAGRISQIILVKPKDNHRYGYHLWLDEATGLMLKADMVNERDVPVEQVMFTTISIGDAAPETQRFHTNPSGQSSASSGIATVQAQVNASAPAARDWQVDQLPAGFRVVEHNKHPIKHGNSPLEHLLITDGLATVSVFIEKLNSKDKFIGTAHRGVVNAYGIINHDYQVTVVGEVPQATVQLIGQSLKYLSEP